MRIADLRLKEVINCRDCERLGFVGDILVDMCTGKVVAIVVPGPCKIWGILGRDQEYIIPFECITQVGTDIVCVDIDSKECLKKFG